MVIFLRAGVGQKLVAGLLLAAAPGGDLRVDGRAPSATSQAAATEAIVLGEDRQAFVITFAKAPDGLKRVHITPAAGGHPGWRIGDFRRGSLLAGRGGRGNRYRLIDSNEVAHDLIMIDGVLMLLRGSRVERRWR